MLHVSSPIIPLAEANRQSKCGKKAAILAQLIAVGFNVPAGFVVTSDVYCWYMSHLGLSCTNPQNATALQREKVRTSILQTDLPSDIHELISEAYEVIARSEAHNAGRIVVRVSAHPHLPGAYESCADVVSLDDLEKAIKKVWASAWTDQAIAIQSRVTPEEMPEIAVIVQQAVDCPILGLTLTANPINGNPQEVVVCTECGDSETRTIVLNLSSMKAEPNASDEIGRVAVIAAEQAILVEKYIACPVEIDWAYDGQTLWVLQAQSLEDIPTYFPGECLGGDNSIFERITRSPVSPLVRSVIYKERSMRAVGFPIGKFRQEWRLINGFVFRRALRVPENNPDGRDPRLQMREIISGERELRRVATELTKLSADVSALLAQDLQRLSDTKLTAILREAVRFYTRSLELLESSQYPSVRFPHLLREFLGSGSEPTSVYQRLVAGASKALVLRDAVIEDFANRLAVARYTGRLGDPEWQKNFRREVEVFAREHCYAFMRCDEPYDAASWRSWVEDIDAIFAIIEALSRQGRRPALISIWEAQRVSVESIQQDLLEAYAGNAGQHLSQLITQSRGWLEARSVAECTCARAGTALRLSLLELGRRLVDRGCLWRPEDVFYLDQKDIRSIAASGGAVGKFKEVIELIAERKHLHWLESRLRAPEVIPTQDEPRLRFDEGKLRGRPCSPGVARGRLRRVYKAADVMGMQPSDILLIDWPAAGWTPLLGLVSGLISETPPDPSLASMAALRGVPYVADCRGVGSVLTDGAWVTVDGSSGVVECEDR